MKKTVLFIAILLMPIFAMAQTTCKQMSADQINKILNYCNKIVAKTVVTLDKGVSLEPGGRPEEEFTIIFDYPYEGCDFYVLGETHGALLSRPMNAKRFYTDSSNNETTSDKATHLNFYFFDNFFKNQVLAFIFSDSTNDSMGGARIVIYKDKKAHSINAISSVDFYDTYGNIIAKTYIPFAENDKENGNLLRCFIDNAYNKYK